MLVLHIYRPHKHIGLNQIFTSDIAKQIMYRRILSGGTPVETVPRDEWWGHRPLCRCNNGCIESYDVTSHPAGPGLVPVYTSSLCCIASVLCMDNWGSIPGTGQEFFLFATASRILSSGFRGGVGVWLTTRFHPVKNSWSYTSALRYVFMACCLVKHKENFTFTFTFACVSVTRRSRHFERLLQKFSS